MIKKDLKRIIASRKIGSLLPILLVAMFLLPFLGACEQPEPGDPVLPGGFQEARIPDASVKGYVYLKPETPFSVSVERFLDDEGGHSLEADVALWTVWVGPRPKDFAMGFQFVAPSDLDTVVGRIEKEPEPRDYLRKGDWLYFFEGDVEWVEAVKTSLGGERSVLLEEAYPDEWELIRLLPESPPGAVVGAGFGKLDDEFLVGLSEQVGGVGSDIESLAEAVNVKSAAFGLYGEVMPAAMPELGEDFLEEMGVSGLIVTRTGYPGFIINFVFSRAASGAGLEKMEIKGGDAYYKALHESLHVLVKNVGSTFFVSGASEMDSARALMESVLTD